MGRIADPICESPKPWPRRPAGRRKGARMCIYITFPIPMFNRIRDEAAERGVSFSSVVTEMLYTAEAVENE